jgi:hypothetical protein
MIAPVLGIDILDTFGVESQSELVDNLVQIAAAVAVVWAWIERRSPKRRLVARRPAE